MTLTGRTRATILAGSPVYRRGGANDETWSPRPWLAEGALA
jgi:hypothetical protein